MDNVSRNATQVDPVKQDHKDPNAYHQKAIEEDPNGVFCFQCEGLNKFYDNYGWIYFNGEALCFPCWNKEFLKVNRL